MDKTNGSGAAVEHLDGYLYQIDYGKGWLPIDPVTVVAAMKQNENHPFHKLKDMYAGAVVKGDGDNRYRAVPRNLALIATDKRLSDDEKKELALSLQYSETMLIADQLKTENREGNYDKAAGLVVELQNLAMETAIYLQSLSADDN